MKIKKKNIEKFYSYKNKNEFLFLSKEFSIKFFTKKIFLGQVAEGLKALDCKSGEFILRRFESYLSQIFFNIKNQSSPLDLKRLKYTDQIVFISSPSRAINIYNQ